MDIDSDAINELESVLDSKFKKDTVYSPEAKYGTYLGKDDNGDAWVLLAGNSEPTPLTNQTVNASVGDTIMVTIANGAANNVGDVTSPSITQTEFNNTTNILRQNVQVIREEGEIAKVAAEEAKAVAEATGQHFWDDDNGAHVTDVTKDEWKTAADNNFPDLSDNKPYHNALWNSLGMLFRRALNNLVSISKSAIAFFDGEGNQDANVVAQFGKDGFRTGLLGESHLVGDYHSLQLVDKEGDTYFHVSDLRDSSGDAKFSESFNGTGGRTEFTVQYDVKSVVSVTDSSNPDNTYTRSGRTFTFATAPRANYKVTIVYYCDTLFDLFAFTFGSRKEGSPIGPSSFAVGSNATASGICSVAEGYRTTANGQESHAEGSNTTSGGKSAHAEGNETYALGASSHAEGNFTSASGACSHAEGIGSVATGAKAHAQNYYTRASGENQTAIGRYNIDDPNNEFALILGNGTSSSARSNALTVDWDGNVECGTVNGVDMDDVMIGKAALLEGGSSIPANADLNTYVNVGTYYANSANAPTLSNSPTTTPFKMIVESSLGSTTYIRQRLQAYNSVVEFTRHSTNGGSTWVAWYRSSARTTSTMPANLFLATPNGSAGYAGYRAIAADDLPTVPISKGGTGATTSANAKAALSLGTAAQNLGFSNPTTAVQILFGPTVDVANASNAYSGKRVGAVWRNTGLTLFNFTDQVGIWTLTLPVPIDQGGTGQTDVVQSSGASRVTASSGVTVSNVYMSKWGPVVMVNVAFQVTAAKAAGAGFTLGTMAEAWRPSRQAGGGSYYCSAQMTAAGVISVNPTRALSANTTYYVDFTYLLA